ncbi:hypothetical protein [Methylocystis heyeri]|uniref:Uncharacterized protein n=1 Tax=Methylocystis heyeri TaxID=391905 RepID=A0A6B8KD63_9HYPH|nr:hypothetical protein [Methylocystis heyeri]QGM46354.1 hypothetical protein H2LOC_011950 [Methylocystis heyeri]
MTLSRRAVSVGLAASAASAFAPPCKAAGRVSMATDLDVDHPWLVQLQGAAAVLVLHEPTGAMFRPGASGKQAFAGVWPDYSPPYALVARVAGAGLLQIAPPAAGGATAGSEPDPDALLRAASRVAKMALAHAAGGEAWLLARPCLSGGSRMVAAPQSGFAGPQGLSFPAGLSARSAGGLKA